MTDNDGAAHQRIDSQCDNTDGEGQGFDTGVSPVTMRDLQQLMVKPTGDYLADLELGSRLAWEFYRRACSSNIHLLMGWAMVDVAQSYLRAGPETTRVDGLGVMIGFAREIARMLAAIHPCRVLDTGGNCPCECRPAVSAETPR